MMLLAGGFPSGETVRLVHTTSVNPIGGIVAHERVVAGRLAAVEIERVRLGDAVHVLLAVGLARVLGL